MWTTGRLDTVHLTLWSFVSGVEVPYVIGYVISLYNFVFLVTTAP